MRVFKWGNSLAIRLRAAIVRALKLNEGDELEARVVGERCSGIARDQNRERALKRIRTLSKELPAGWKLDRDKANAR